MAETLHIDNGQYSLAKLHKDMVGKTVIPVEDFYKDISEEGFADSVDILRTLTEDTDTTPEHTERRREQALWESQSSEPLRWSVELIANAIDTQIRAHPDQKPYVEVSITELEDGGCQVLISDRSGPGGEGMNPDVFFNTFLKPYASGSAESSSSIGTMGVGSQQAYGLCKQPDDRIFISSEKDHNLLVTKIQQNPKGELQLAVSGKTKNPKAAVAHGNGTRILAQLSQKTAREMGLSSSQLIGYLRDKFGGVDWADVTVSANTQRSEKGIKERRSPEAIQFRRIQKNREQEQSGKETYEITGQASTYDTIVSGSGSMKLEYSTESTTEDDPYCLVYLDVLGVGFGNAQIIEGINLPKEIRLNISEKIENITEARTDIRLQEQNVKDFIEVLKDIGQARVPVDLQIKLLRALEGIYSRFQDTKLLPPHMRNRKEYRIWGTYLETLQEKMTLAQKGGVLMIPKELVPFISGINEDYIVVPRHLATAEFYTTLHEAGTLKHCDLVTTADGTKSIYFIHAPQSIEPVITVGKLICFNTAFFPDLDNSDPELQRAELVKAQAVLCNRSQMADGRPITLKWNAPPIINVDEPEPKDYSSEADEEVLTDWYNDEDDDVDNPYQMSARNYEQPAPLYTDIIDQAHEYFIEISYQWESLNLNEKRRAISNLIFRLDNYNEEVFKFDQSYNVHGSMNSELQQYWEIEEEKLDILFEVIGDLFDRDKAQREYPDIPSWKMYATQVSLRFMTCIHPDVSYQQLEALKQITYTVSNEVHRFQDFPIHPYFLTQKPYSPELLAIWSRNPKLYPGDHLQDKVPVVLDTIDKLNRPMSWKMKAIEMISIPGGSPSGSNRDFNNNAWKYFLTNVDYFTEETLDIFTTDIIANDDSEVQYKDINPFLRGFSDRLTPPDKVISIFYTARQLGVTYEEISRYLFSNNFTPTKNVREIGILKYMLENECDLEHREITHMQTEGAVEIAPEKLLLLVHGQQYDANKPLQEQVEGISADSAELKRSLREMLHPINRLSPVPGSSYKELLKNSVQAVQRASSTGQLVDDKIEIRDFQTITDDHRLAYCVEVRDFAGMDPEQALVKLTVPTIGEGMHGLGFLKLLADADEVLVQTSKGAEIGVIHYIPIKNTAGTVVDIKVYFTKDQQQSDAQFKGTTVTMVKYTPSPEIEASIFRSQIEQEAIQLPSTNARIYMNPEQGSEPVNKDHLVLDTITIPDIGVCEIKHISSKNTVLTLSINESDVPNAGLQRIINKANIPYFARKLIIDSGLSLNIRSQSVSTTRDGSGIKNADAVEAQIQSILENSWKSIVFNLASTNRMEPSQFITSIVSPRFFSHPGEFLNHAQEYTSSDIPDGTDNKQAADWLAYEPLFIINGNPTSLFSIAEGFRTGKILEADIPTRLVAAMKASILRGEVSEEKIDEVVILPQKTFIERPEDRLAIHIKENREALFTKADTEQLGAILIKAGAAVGLPEVGFILHSDEGEIQAGSGSTWVHVYKTQGIKNAVAFYSPRTKSLHFSAEMFVLNMRNKHNLLAQGNTWETATHELVHTAEHSEETNIIHPPEFYKKVEKALLQLQIV